MVGFLVNDAFIFEFNHQEIPLKKIAMASAALLALVNAQAQSTVTVFGVADIGYVHTSASGVTKNQLASDGNTSSRLGFRGTEDLGGGMKASFWVEGALAIDNPSALTLASLHSRVVGLFR